MDAVIERIGSVSLALYENCEIIGTTWSGVTPETMSVTELDQKFPAISCHIHKIPSLYHIPKQINAIPWRVLKGVLPVGRILHEINLVHLLLPHFLRPN